MEDPLKVYHDILSISNEEGGNPNHDPENGQFISGSGGNNDMDDKTVELYFDHEGMNTSYMIDGEKFQGQFPYQDLWDSVKDNKIILDNKRYTELKKDLHDEQTSKDNRRQEYNKRENAFTQYMKEYNSSYTDERHDQMLKYWLDKYISHGGKETDISGHIRNMNSTNGY